MFSKIISLLYRFAPFWIVNLALKFKLSSIEKRRIREISLWLKCADSLAQKTNHKHAQEITDFLSTEGFAATPKPNGFQVIQLTPRMRLPITVLIPEDKDVGGMWKSQFDMSDGHMANFVRDSSNTFAILCLKGHVPTSDFAKGLLCLHEGKHAWHFFHSRHKNKVEQLNEELDVLEFECELVDHYFGEKYRAFIQNEVARIANLSKNGKRPVDYEWFAKTSEDFATQFQQPVDTVEKALFTTILIHAIMFRFLEKYGSQDSRADKVHFVRHVLHQSSRK